MYDDISIISNASKTQQRDIHVFFSFDRLKFRVELMSEFHLVVIVSPRQEVGSINRRRETTGPPPLSSSTEALNISMRPVRR